VPPAPLTTVVVFAGGPAPDARALAAVPRDAVAVAADRGAEHALAAGARLELAVGDFDSLPAATLRKLERAGVRLDRQPRDKDATDLELALDAAYALRPQRIVVVGGAAGRLDHLLGEVSLLASDAYRDVQVDAVLGGAAVAVVRGERTLVGAVGELLSLLALHGPAVGVATEGLRYPLRGETLEPGSTRGVSNVFVAPQARVSLERGVLLAVRPGSSSA